MRYGNAITINAEGVKLPSLEFLQRFREANETRMREAFNSLGQHWGPDEWIACMIGEIGEAANITKKIYRVETGFGSQDEEYVQSLVEQEAKEVADVFVYLDLWMISSEVPWGNEGLSLLSEEIVFAIEKAENISLFRMWSHLAYLMGHGDSGIAKHVSFMKDQRAVACVVLLFLSIFAAQRGFDLEQAIIDKFNEVSDRVGSEVRL